MANASSLYGLMKFLNREAWRDAFAETMHEHFFVACKSAGIDMDELAGVPWLKYLENQARKRHDPGDPLATYDVGWLWTELGVTELRV